MSMIARKTSFYPAGKAAWQGGLSPCWRGGPEPVVDVPPPPGYWWHEEALLAADFVNGRFMRGGTEMVATGLFTTTRSSGINLPDAEGVFQQLGNNGLPRTDRGLYVNGQIAALNANGNNPQSSTGWDNEGSPVVTSGPTVAGLFQSVYIKSGGNVNDFRRINLGSLPQNAPIGIKVRFGPGIVPTNFVRIRIGNSTAEGPPGAIIVTAQVNSTFVLVSQTTMEARFVFTPTVGAAWTLRVGPGTTDTSKDVRLDGVEVTNIPFVSDAWVSTTSPAATMLASDIRTVQDIRPSNGLPEPFPGWEAAGLDDGFSVLLDFENRFLYAARRFPVSLYDGGAINVRLETNANGQNFILRGNDGMNNTTLTAPGGQTGGRSRAAFRVSVGGEAVIAQMGSGAVASGTIGVPTALKHLVIGNNPTLQEAWNDWIYGLQICPPLSDVQLVDWVSAA